MSVAEFGKIVFEEATRAKVMARIGYFGPSSSGKSLSGLRCARRLQEIIEPGKKFAVIDTEHARVHLYAEEPEFKHPSLDGAWFRVYSLRAPYSPAHYIAAIDQAERAGATVLFIDSISHEWF